MSEYFTARSARLPGCWDIDRVTWRPLSNEYVTDVVDIVRSERVAECHVRALNAGAAMLRPTATLGCRVMYTAPDMIGQGTLARAMVAEPGAHALLTRLDGRIVA